MAEIGNCIDVVLNMGLSPAERVEALRRINQLYRHDPQGEEVGYSKLPEAIRELLERLWEWEQRQRVSQSNCQWIPANSKGNGLCVADSEYVMPSSGTYNNVRGMTMGELHNENHIEGIYYNSYQPDFSTCAYDSIELATNSFSRYQADMSVDESGIEDSIHEQAIAAFAKKWGKSVQEVRDFLSDIHTEDYNKRRLYVLHECVDIKTVMIVPREIHAFYKHSGGISLYKSLFR